MAAYPEAHCGKGRSKGRASNTPNAKPQSLVQVADTYQSTLCHFFMDFFSELFLR